MSSSGTGGGHIFQSGSSACRSGQDTKPVETGTIFTFALVKINNPVVEVFDLRNQVHMVLLKPDRLGRVQDGCFDKHISIYMVTFI